MNTRTVPTTRTLYQHMARFRKTYALHAQGLVDRLTGALVRAAPGVAGTIPPRDETRVLIEVGRLTQRHFVGEDGRTALAGEGTEPQSMFADSLQQALTSVTLAVVQSHSAFLNAQLPADVKAWLRTAYIAEQEPRIPNPVRLNPLARYDPFHTWVDPRGYRLSDRIWQLSVRARTQVDQLVADGIRAGQSSLVMSRALEQHLLPGRTTRTNRPYGTSVSYDAMRLARTEIARAHAAASLAAGRGNPFVTGFDWALSVSHPRVDICDRLATIGMAGERLRDPYPADDDVPQPVDASHPQCLCSLRPSVTAHEEEVIESLRAMMATQQPPPLTVLDPELYTITMLGRWSRRLLSALRDRSEDLYGL